MVSPPRRTQGNSLEHTRGPQGPRVASGLAFWSMDLTELAGTSFGPVPHQITSGHVADFVAATSDDPQRWATAAPPGYAAALLFRLAPDFLWSEAVLPFTKVLLHSEQQFTWLAPLRVGADLVISSRVESVRVRGTTYFVGFSMNATDHGFTVLESSSTFLMGADRAESSVVERQEPEASERAVCNLPAAASGEESVLLKSASRADLVRYAAASGDFNPLHWDHATAVAAGVPGVIAHGLLMAAWAAQAAASHTEPVLHPLATLKVRFRSPLFPAAQAVVSASRTDEQVDLVVATGEDRLVTGKATVAPVA